MTRGEKMDFVNLWHVMIIISDLMTIVGTALKIAVTYKVSSRHTVRHALLSYHP